MKRIKRTLSLMILAGMLTAGLASCVVRGNGDGSGEVPTGTEPIIIDNTGTTDSTVTPAPSTDPTQVAYTAVDDYVYVATASASLKLTSDVTQTKQLAQFTELHRVGKASNWCKVEHEGAEYYVQTKVITTDDIGERTFTDCNPVKTMYTSGSVNLRKFPSAEDFSTKKTFPNGTEVKVVRQSTKGWSKVELTVDGIEYKGYMSTQHLTASPSGEADDFLQYFTRLDVSVTMYVTSDSVNIRMKPYADDRGTLVVQNGLPKGTQVKVIARGIVEGTEWSMVEWTENSVNKSYYIATKYLSVTASGSNATLEQMLNAYPELETFETEQTLYVLADINSATVRSAPTRVDVDNKSNAIEYLKAKDAVTAVAVGVIKGQNPKGEEEEMTWCLSKHETEGYCFIAYSNLTRNSDGTPATPVISLDKLVEMYSFTKTHSAVAKKTKVEALLYSEPRDASSSIKLNAGISVTVVAQGTTTDGFTSNSWYIVEYEGSFYFVIQSLLQDA